MKIIDCFTFYNELELLNYRLNILNNIIDYFILVEANQTYTGNKKGLFFDENKNLYDKFKNKIIHIIIDLPLNSENIKSIFKLIVSFFSLSKNNTVIKEVDDVDDETYEVTVKGTIKGVIGDQVLFLAEVEQAGLFEIKNFPADQMAPTLEVTCPGMIYPALRYNLADMMSRAGFQPINLNEISFRAIYEQRLADAKKKAEAETAAAVAAPATPAPTAEAAIKAAIPAPQEGVNVVVEDGKVVVKPAQ